MRLKEKEIIWQNVPETQVSFDAYQAKETQFSCLAFQVVAMQDQECQLD